MDANTLKLKISKPNFLTQIYVFAVNAVPYQSTPPGLPLCLTRLFSCPSLLSSQRTLWAATPKWFPRRYNLSLSWLPPPFLHLLGSELHLHPPVWMCLPSSLFATPYPPTSTPNFPIVSLLWKSTWARLFQTTSVIHIFFFFYWFCTKYYFLLSLHLWIISRHASIEHLWM